MSSESPLSVKVRHGDEFRRFTIETFPLTFAMLAKHVRTIFALQPTVSLVLRYQDNENDLITLSTDMEVAEALRFLGSSNRVLRLQLTLPPAPAAAKAAAAPKAPAAKPPAAKPAAAGTGVAASTPAAAKPAAKPAAPTATAAAPAPTAVAAGLSVTSGGPAPAPTPATFTLATPAPAPAPAPAESANTAVSSAPKADKLAERQRRIAEREQLMLLKAQEKAEREAVKAEEIKRREEEKKELLRKKMQEANETGTTDSPAVHVQLLKAEVQRLKAELKLAKAEKDGVAPGKALLWARFVRDVSVPDGSVLQPNETFVKTWRFRNELDKPWPAGTRLLFVGKNSDRLGAPDEVLIAECLQPLQELDVSVPLVAPAAPGRYTAYFRLATAEGKKFGQRVWVIISVGSNDNNSSGEENDPATAAPTAEALAPFSAQLAVLAELRFTNDALNLRLLRKFNGTLEHVIEALMRRRAKVQKMRAAAAVAAASAPARALAAPVAIPVPPAHSTAAVAPAIPSAALPFATTETPTGDALALPLAPAPAPAPALP